MGVNAKHDGTLFVLLVAILCPFLLLCHELRLLSPPNFMILSMDFFARV